MKGSLTGLDTGLSDDPARIIHSRASCAYLNSFPFGGTGEPEQCVSFHAAESDGSVA